MVSILLFLITEIFSLDSICHSVMYKATYSNFLVNIRCLNLLEGEVEGFILPVKFAPNNKHLNVFMIWKKFITTKGSNYTRLYPPFPTLIFFSFYWNCLSNTLVS